MTDLIDYLSPPVRSGRHQNLATRLFQLAADTDRVGLHREASVLAAVAASVLERSHPEWNRAASRLSFLHAY